MSLAETASWSIILIPPQPPDSPRLIKAVEAELAKKS